MLSFINVPFGRYSSLAPFELLQQERRITHSPTVDGRVTDRDAALSHHPLKIAPAEAVS